jgi:hypothetical protein
MGKMRNTNNTLEGKNLKERDHMEDLVIYESVTLTLILRKQNRMCELD